MKQNRDSTYSNRIRGNHGRTSQHHMAKSRSIKDRGCKSGGCAGKAAKLTSGGLRRVWETGLGGSRDSLTAAQKSAAGVVSGDR